MKYYISKINSISKVKAKPMTKLEFNLNHGGRYSGDDEEGFYIEFNPDSLQIKTGWWPKSGFNSYFSIIN